MIGLTVVSFSPGGTRELAQDEMTRLQNLLRFAHEQSVIRAQEYGLRFYETGYRFMQYDETTRQWNDIEGDRLLYARQLPEPLELNLYIEQLPVELLHSAADEPEPELDKQDELEVNTEQQNIKPQVFLLSSGELTPAFEISLRIPGSDINELLQGRPEGVYERRKAQQ